VFETPKRIREFRVN